MRKRRRQAIWVVVILVVGLGASLLIPGVRRLLVSSNNDKAFALMNHDRTSHGLRALAHQSQLQSYAQNWADHMAAQGHSEHDSIERHICCWDVLGENVGEGSTLELIEKAFMQSPEHRKNILYPTYTQAGVGVAYNAKQKLFYVTQAFRDPSRTSRSAPRATPTKRRHSVTPQVVPKRTPTRRSSPTPKPSASPTVTPSPSVLAPSPVVVTPTPTPTVRQVHHRRSLVEWIIIGVLIAFIVGLAILVAFVRI